MANKWDAAAVRELRRSMRMTQAEFAKEAGVTRGRVNRWEHGESPSLASLKALDEIYADHMRQITGVN